MSIGLGKGVSFHTVGEGNGSIPEVEAKFDDLVADKLKEINEEYYVSDSPEEEEDSEPSSEEEYVAASSNGTFWGNMKYNWKKEHEAVDGWRDKMDKKEAKKEKRKLMRQKRREKMLEEREGVMEGRPFALGLVLTVQDITKFLM